MAVHLHQRNFKTLAGLVEDQTKSLDKLIDAGTELAKWRISRDITDWISTANPFQDHADVRQRLGDDYLGTGQWLFQDAEYTTWRQSSSGILLLQGIVGTGKSCVASIAIESLMENPDGCLAFFYCANESSDGGSGIASARARRDTAHIFRSILAQCSVLPDGSIAKPVEDAFKLSRRQGPGESNLNIGTVLKLLRDVLESRNGQLTLVFDALDELDDHADFLERIQQLCNIGKRIRVLSSSRPSVDVAAGLPEEDVIVISVQSLNAHDISFYVDHELERRFPKTGLNPNQDKAWRGLTDRLRNALENWSEGV